MRLTPKQLLSIALDEYGQALERHGLREDLCFFGLMPGAAFLADYVDCGGMAWLQVVDGYNTVKFPTPDGQERACEVGQPALTLTVGLLRKAPLLEVLNNEPIPPSQEEQTDATLQQMDDYEAMHDFLRTLAAREDVRVVMSIYTPTGPEGDALGATWNFAVASEN